ncbi:helix-turn-helix domain-containing protein [Brachybacterium massiliense]|uniref:helix-turn-helix domain-containing protein n=1 Tax=Brachybacterium massiliense TaxID=1755098 RepID=UPI000B3BCE4F|nr:helix-turn-helix transcriptional regulator [Brachybacterium massiliense]
MNTQERYYAQLAEAGRAVVEQRVQLGLSQASLATEAGVDAKTLRSLERGERWPHDTSRAKIERALGWAEGTLHALFVGDSRWTEIEYPGGDRRGGIMQVRAPHGPIAGVDAAPDEVESNDSYDGPPTAVDLTASELAALLVTRSQALERRIRILEKERDSLSAQLRAKQEDGEDDAE